MFVVATELVNCNLANSKQPEISEKAPQKRECVQNCQFHVCFFSLLRCRRQTLNRALEVAALQL